LFLPLASVVGLPPLFFLDNFDGRIQSFVVVIILVITTSTAYKPRGKWGGPGKEKTNKQTNKKKNENEEKFTISMIEMINVLMV
jgi:hypothetical protein